MALFRCASGSSGGGATITVTYSSDFYGETVTCSHGTKTYSKVATSSGTLEFSVDEEGTWTISCTIGSDTFSTTADVDLTYDAELVSLPDGETVLPTNDIQIWLKCAGITDKSYTTLSEVLADSETYNALLGDSNACAYMKRSTTWSTDICADQYAMNLLGQYDTACDALLSDSTWLNAICNSTYFQLVLDVEVPLMTSNTTPEGECICSGQTNNQWAYQSFDRSQRVDDGWYHRANPCWLGYIFPQPVRVNYFFIQEDNATPVIFTKYDVQASNDGTDWVTLGSYDEGSAVAAQYFYHSFVNEDYYTYYRFYIYSPASCQTANFYGRHAVGEKIHGGNPTYDSFYRIVDGSHVPVTDPSLLDAGTYTIYSNGLAKAPDNLSNDYGKTVRICPNTKEIVVRPDNSLYWYGVMLNSCEDMSVSNGWSGTQASSLVSPVHNNTDITITCSSTQLGGIGSKYAVNTTTVKAVMQGVTASSGDYGSAGYQTSKTTWDYATYSTKLTSNAITLVTYTGTSGSRFVTAKCNNNRKNIIYALWHE